MNLIPDKTYRCVFCELRMAGSKFVEHAKEHHHGAVHAITPPDAKTWNEQLPQHCEGSKP